MAERPWSQLGPPAGPRELEPTSKVDAHGPAGVGSAAVSARPPVTAAYALDVGEQIHRLQALVELRAAGILTEAELMDLKRRVLSPGSDAPLEVREALQPRRPGNADAAAAGNGRVPPAGAQRTATAVTGVPPVNGGAAKARKEASGGSGPALNRKEPKGNYVTTLKVVGTIPITYNFLRNGRASYLRWKEALDIAAAEAADAARPTTSELFSLRIELRLYMPGGQGSDLDNYVKPIQDALAERGVFGPTAHQKSPMKGDEHVDHLDLRRRRVKSETKAGVLAEVWALDA